MFKVVQPYLQLMRFDRPIGTILFIWPAWWALWLASNGEPPLSLFIIFTLGAFIMRSAGCIVNDIADRNIDNQVKRTKSRPLARGAITVTQALLLLAFLTIVGLSLFYFLNPFAQVMVLVAVVLSVIYPFLKRITHWPQIVLGFACSWSIPTVYAALLNTIPPIAWLLLIAAVLWSIAYDTIYAMVDRDDDIHLNLKSTAILFGEYDQYAVAILQALSLSLFAIIGVKANLNFWFYTALLIATFGFIHQLLLIQDGDRNACFKAFNHNRWIGFIIFSGFVLGI